MTETASFSPIGTIQSCYREKFGIPRQPGLVEAAEAVIHLSGYCNHPDAVRELAHYSHLWIVFQFHASMQDNPKLTVRPPRLGGNQRVGVFATRSNFRPNPIGLSVVKLEKVETSDHQVKIHIRGGDFLDGTPVLDIKPYLPYADCLPEATATLMPEKSPLSVTFSENADQAIAAQLQFPNLKALITAMLAQDPRPAYQNQPDRIYGCRLYDFNIQFQVTAQTATVIALEEV